MGGGKAVCWVHWPLRAEGSIMHQTMYHGPIGYKRVEVGMIIIARKYTYTDTHRPQLSGT